MSDLLRPEPPASWRDRARELTASLRPARVAAAVLVVVVTAVAATWLLRAPAPPVEASLPMARSTGSSVPVPGSAAVAVPSTSTSAGEVVVQAAGAVVVPGVYRLPAGARVADLIAAAGGVTPTADPGAVLLAATVTDGERVYVPEVGESPPPSPPPASEPSAGPGGVAAASGPIDLNTATATELDGLPGVGPATAAAIIAHRDSQGPFTSVDQLLDVRGIGQAKLDALRSLVTV